jgi:hypothetical protein
VDAGHDAHLRPAPLELAAQLLEVAAAESLVMQRIVAETIQGRGLREDQGVQVSGNDDTVPAEVGAEEFRGDRLHCAHAGAAAEHQGAVDVEKHERLGSRHRRSRIAHGQSRGTDPAAIIAESC